MQRHLFQRGAVIVASLAVCGGIFAQGTPSTSPSVPATPPRMTPALPPLAPTVPVPATTQPTQPLPPSVPVQPATTPPTPLAPSVPVPSATTQPTQPLTNPASQPGYGGQGYAAPTISGAGQAVPVPDARMLSRSDSAPTAFRALDPMNRGYVTRADTDKINGFMGFDSADTDRDGRLTPDEFYNAWKFFAQ